MAITVRIHSEVSLVAQDIPTGLELKVSVCSRDLKCVILSLRADEWLPQHAHRRHTLSN